MVVNIIHRAARTDRIKQIAKLIGVYPQAELVDAVVPDWESNPHSKAVRGCSLSHLAAVSKFLGAAGNDDGLLVLEDDADPIGDQSRASEELTRALPDDAGVVILGGDVENYGDDVGGYSEVLPKFFGTHAVLYTRALGTTTFLTNAYRIMASNCVGAREGHAGVCFESVLLSALRGTGLKAYRPHTMAFKVVESSGDSGVDSGTRTKATYTKYRSGLMPMNTWEPLFGPMSCKRVHLCRTPGNAGDALIRAATMQLFRWFGVQHINDPTDAIDYVLYPCGGLMGRHKFHDYGDGFAQLSGSAKAVILPHTWYGPDEYTKHAQEVWCREGTSPNFINTSSTVGVMHDLSLAYHSALKGSFERPEGIFFRNDAERTDVPVNNIADPAMVCRTHYEYLMLAGSFKRIHTNRLHFAIAGLIMGSDVTLYDCDYHKNKSVYEFSLKGLGCKWGERR